MRSRFPIGALLAAGACLFSTCGLASAAQSQSQSFAAVPAGAGLRLNASMTPAGVEIAQDQALHLTFALHADDAGLQEYAAEVYDSSSPNYHHWLTPDEVGQRFGASTTDIQAVQDWAKANGMQITQVWGNRRFISASVPAGTAQAVLGTHLSTYFKPSARVGVSPALSDIVFAPDQEPLLPASIAAKVSYIAGLTNAVRAIRHDSAQAATPLTSPLTPAQIAKIYDLSRVQNLTNSGQGLTIGVFSPVLLSTSDVQTFESKYGISAPSIIEKWPTSTGRSTDNKASDMAESALDAEMLVSQAPNAQIVMYEAPNDGTSSLDQFNQMAQDNPPVISFSYSFPESSDPSTQAGLNQLNAVLQQMAVQGISVFGASGDSGPYDDSSQPNTPLSGIPASSPYATGVGGTALPDTSSDGYWSSEIGWNDSSGITGGGNSIMYPRPSWQTGPGVVNSHSNGDRQVPDVSAIAGSPGVNIYAGGKWQIYGGTSVSAPIWAAAGAMLGKATNQRLGNFSPTLYTLANNPTVYATAFHDITSGSDQLFSCTPGWDYLTGLGSADFYELYLYLNSQYPIHSYTTGLQMISAPFQYGGADVSTLFDSTPKLAVWNPSSKTYSITPTAPANTLTPGQAYWVRVGQSLNLTSSGSPVADTPLHVPLTAGWNMIGDPFNAPVVIGTMQVITSGQQTLDFNTAVSQGVIGPTLYTYDPNQQAYTTAGSTTAIQPFAGYWLYAPQNCTLVIPPSS